MIVVTMTALSFKIKDFARDGHTLLLTLACGLVLIGVGVTSTVVRAFRRQDGMG
jgi:hypothetical protein